MGLGPGIGKDQLSTTSALPEKQRKKWRKNSPKPRNPPFWPFFHHSFPIFWQGQFCDQSRELFFFLFRARGPKPNFTRSMGSQTKPLFRKQQRPTVSKQDLTVSQKDLPSLWSDWGHCCGTCTFPRTREGLRAPKIAIANRRDFLSQTSPSLAKPQWGRFFPQKSQQESQSLAILPQGKL